MSRNRRRKGRPQISTPWEPLRRAVRVPLTAEAEERIRAIGGDDDLLAELSNAELWRNHRYTVTVTRRADESVEELSIRRNDRKPVHDWRDFQRIKTEIAGAEVEGFELYPAEDRLMDTANQYYIFCLLPGQRIPAGYSGARNLRDDDEAIGGSKQRKLPADWISQLPERSQP